MTSDTLNNAIGHLGEQFKRAQPILLTGAGFSVAAKNIIGTNVPTGGELKKILWNLCFENATYEESSTLQDLFQTARTRHGGALVKLLIENFTVHPDSLPDWYRTFFSFPWLRCYTLNIDDLETALQRRFSFPRRLSSISATARGPANREQRQGTLEVIHLNGTLGDLPDNVTFSLSQYAERLSREDVWYDQLVADMLSHPVVFIGTQVDEPPMWQYVEKRRSRGGRSERELRPKSYLVTKSLSMARQACLVDYNIVFLPMVAEDFSKSVLEPLKPSSEIGAKFLADLSQEGKGQPEDVKEVGQLAVSPKERTEFLFGSEPEWSDIQAGRAAERESDQALWSAAEAAMKLHTARGYILISGTAGTGKSTSLKRLALRLSGSGHRVAWVESQLGLSPRSVKNAMTGSNPPAILAIDDADIYGTELSSMIAEVSAAPSRPLILVAIRAGRVDRVFVQTQLKTIPQREVVIPPLTDPDIDNLLQVLERENRLGVLLKLAPDERRRRFAQKCGRQLLVAMMEATSGAPFERKITSELEQLEPEGQHIYALLAIVTAWRLHLTRNELLVAIGETTNKVLNALRKLAERHIIRNPRDDVYISRHRVIAEVVVKQLIQNGMMPDLLYGLAIAAANQVGPVTPPNSRLSILLQRIVNHESLMRAIGVEEARNLYGKLEPLLAWNFNYWLHRGSLEVEEKNLNFAETCLNNALSLNSADHNTHTEYAYLLFRKAIANPSGENAVDYVSEADRLLTGNIAFRGFKDPHSYHVLGSNMLDWINKGMVAKAEKKAEFERIIPIVRRGREMHPKNEHLRRLLEQLEDEYRMLAVVV